MKNFLYSFWKTSFPVFMLLMLTIGGCTKDEQPVPVETEISERFNVAKTLEKSKKVLEEVKEATGCFDQVAEVNGKPSFGELHGTIGEIGVAYIDVLGRTTFAYPLFSKEGETQNLLLVGGKEQQQVNILPYADLPLAQESVNGTTIPQNISNIFDAATYLKGEIDYKELNKVLGDSYRINGDSKTLLLVENKSLETISGPTNIVSIKGDAFCADLVDEMLGYYSNYFGLGNLAVGSSMYEVFFNAIAATQPGTGVYCKCPIQWVVMENMINATNSDPTLQAELLTGYIGSILDLDGAEETWLANNLGTAAEISLFLSRKNSQYDQSCGYDGLAASVADSYLNLNMTADDDWFDFIPSFEDIIDPAIWELAKEITVDALVELFQEQLADIIPGGTLLTVGPILYANLQQGNWLESVYNAIDITLNELDVVFPCAKAAAFGVGIYDKFGLVKKIYRPLKKLKNGGQDFVVRMYQLLRDKIGGLTAIKDKFQWLGQPLGSILDGETASEWFDWILEEFDDTAGFAFMYNGNPVFQLIENPLDPTGKCVYVELYPDSSVGQPWTIAFYYRECDLTSAPSGWSTTGVLLKIRFDF